MSYEDIVVTKDEGVGVIRLNRPKVLNALSKRLYREVDAAISDMEADADVKAVIFTGTGERAFSAGADIHEQVRDAENPPPPGPEPRRIRLACGDMREADDWGAEWAVIRRGRGDGVELRHSRGVRALALPLLGGVLRSRELDMEPADAGGVAEG